MFATENLRAFVLSAELGSFSAAARYMRKAQSAVSTAIGNLEIDTGTTLFDRSSRAPTLTDEGRELLPHARGILLGHKEMMAKASSMGDRVEKNLCLAIEQGIEKRPVLQALEKFNTLFPHVSLEFLSPGPNDVGSLLDEGRADLGLMTEQEDYPTEFQFRGVGHTLQVAVCNREHPLAQIDLVTHRDLRQYRQIILRSRSLIKVGHLGERISPTVWHAENSDLVVDMVKAGFGWSELPLPVVRSFIKSGEVVRLRYANHQSDVLKGLDVVWTRLHALGPAGQWLRDHLLSLPQTVWRGDAAT